MTDFYKFASESPWLTFFLFWISAWIVSLPFTVIFRSWNRYLRSKNIRERGWPPEYLDADGDFKPEPSKD